jgi:hypothetical protein
MATIRGAGVAAAAAALLGIAAGSFLPWFRSGRRARSSYELFDIVDRIGLVPGVVAQVAITVWLAVPAAVAVALACLVLGRVHLGAVLVVVLGSYTALLAVTVSSATGSWESGTILATVGGVAATVAGVVLLSGQALERMTKAEPA